jgi:hypothetical protein
MKVYRLCLLSGHGTIAAVQRFSADADAEALGMARETVNGSFGLTSFELWEGRRKVRAESRKRERKV